MLTGFSWNDFTYAFLLLLLVYYISIVLLYYRNEMQEILSNRHKLSFLSLGSNRTFKSENSEPPIDNSRIDLPIGSADKKGQISESHPDANEGFNKLLLQIQDSIIRASEEKMVKQELLWMLRSLLQQFDHLKNTDNIIAISDFVILLVENNCHLNLSQEDVNLLWK